MMPPLVVIGDVTTGEEVEERIGELHRVRKPEYRRDDGHGAEDRKGDPRLDDLADKKIDKSHEEGDRTSFSSRSADIGEQHLGI